jgi:transposase
VVFGTELLAQLRNRGIDLDRVSHLRARQDRKMLDKTSNTKHAAQLIAEYIQGWLPTKTTDPDSQHEITNLRNQLADRADQPVGTSPL